MDPVTFVFLLTTWSPDVPHAMVDVTATGLSATECTTAMAEYNRTNPTWTDGNPSCEIDTGDWEESNSHAYAVEVNGTMYV